MELRHLRYVVALGEELHFGRAAKRVNITQPPFSKQIKELEAELGVMLFSRKNKIVRLTEPGKIFLQQTKKILELVDSAIKTTRRAERGEVGRIAIGYLAAAPYHLLPTVLRRYRASYPNVEVALYGMVTVEQLKALAQGTIDIGIMRPTYGLAEFDSEVILREPFVVALPDDHKLARQKDIDIRNLASEKFVMLPSVPKSGLYRQIVEICIRAEFEPDVVQVANETRSIVELVAAGIGVSIVPSSVQRMPGVVYKKLRGVKAYAEMVVVWRKEGKTPVIAQFLHVLGEVFRR